MKPSWWMLAMALGVAGALVVHHHIKSSKRTVENEEDEWPYEKNFGAFPPEIPASVFEGLT